MVEGIKPAQTVAIVGVGLIGGSIGLALRQRRLARSVVGVARRKATLSLGRRLGAIDRGTLDLARGVADAELTIFCTPVPLIVRQALEAAPHCPPGAVLTDVGSTKLEIVERLEAGLPGGVSFVGSHPLAGSEKRGLDQARPDLFEGCVCVVTRTSHTARKPFALVQQFWESLGARVITMPPDLHDRALACTSHLPHLVAAALAIVLPSRYRQLAASGFRDTTRIAASDPEMWSGIFLENAEPLLETLSDYEKTLGEFRLALQRRDRKHLEELWKRSKVNREVLDKEDRLR